MTERCQHCGKRTIGGHKCGNWRIQAPYKAGRRDRIAGGLIDHNPYPAQPPHRRNQWLQGWREADADLAPMVRYRLQGIMSDKQWWSKWLSTAKPYKLNKRQSEAQTYLELISPHTKLLYLVRATRKVLTPNE